MNILKYFAYGSNMNPERMNKRNISFYSRKRAILKNFSLQFNKIASANPKKEGKANIMEAEEFVEGALYEIESSDRGKLDKAEGYPIHYDRIPVLVQLDDLTEVESFAYIAQPDWLGHRLKPTKEYLKHLLISKDILSEDYYAKLESWPTLD